MKINYHSKLLSSILTTIRNGALSVPSFQRDFTWSSLDMANLMTSITMRDEPFGSIVIWNDTKTSKAIPQTNEIFKQLTKSQTNQIRQYLIDGQQRITSFAQLYLLNINVNAKHVTKGNKIYLSFKKFSNKFSNKIEFVSRNKGGKFFLEAFHLFETNDEFKKYIKDELKKQEYNSLKNEVKTDIQMELMSTWNKFNQIQLGIIEIDSDDLNSVIDVFTLINTKGKKLSPFNIVHAYYTKENKEFDLAKKFKEINNYIKEELKLKNETWEITDNLLMMVLYSIKDDTISNKDMIDLASGKSSNTWTKMEYLNKKEKGFQELILHTVKTLIDIGFSKIKLLPSTIYVNHVARYIYKKEIKSLTSEEKQILESFFKKSIINKRHTSGNDGIKKDGFLIDSDKLINHDLSFEWDLIEEFDENDILSESYNSRTARGKYIIAKMIKNLKSFATGNSVFINTKEDWKLNLHHIFPKTSKYKDEDDINSLGNITPLEFNENNNISNQLPKDYLSNKSNDSLKKALINKEFNDFKRFVKQRCVDIAKKLNEKW